MRTLLGSEVLQALVELPCFIFDVKKKVLYSPFLILFVGSTKGVVVTAQNCITKLLTIKKTESVH